MKKDIAKQKFFATREPQSDVEGDLELSVRFAQSSIVLTKNNHISGDYQPHLVSERDTLLLCKPLNRSVPVSESISVWLYNKDGSVFVSNQVSHDNVPLLLGKLPSDIDFNDDNFTEPDVYEYTISKQSEFSKMFDDPTGSYLANLLTR